MGEPTESTMACQLCSTGVPMSGIMDHARTEHPDMWISGAIVGFGHPLEAAVLCDPKTGCWWILQHSGHNMEFGRQVIPNATWTWVWWDDDE